MEQGYYSYDPVATLSKHVVVIGMSGSHAVAAASLLSQRTGLVVTEVLRGVEHEHGQSIGPLTRELGPGGIARAEGRVLKRAMSEQCHLIAGGDALLSTWLNRRWAKNAHKVFFEAPLDLVRQRVTQSPEAYPDLTRREYTKAMDQDRLAELHAQLGRQARWCDSVIVSTKSIVEQTDMLRAELESAGVLQSVA